MIHRRLWRHKRNPILVVARAGASTWAVARSRRLIPGALFRTREAALKYAALLASAAGLGPRHIRVLA